jgi:hypothetical protein
VLGDERHKVSALLRVYLAEYYPAVLTPQLGRLGAVIEGSDIAPREF